MLNLNAKIVAPVSPAPSRSRRAKLPPTRGQVQVAAEFIASALGAGEAFARSIFTWAIASVVSAWAVVGYARLTAKAQKVLLATGEKPNFRASQEVVDNLEAALKAQKQRDIGQAKDAGEDEEAKETAAVRLLKGIPRGERLSLCPAQRDLVVETLAPIFQVPNSVPFAQDLPAEILGRRGFRQGFALWLIEQLADPADFAQFMSKLESLEEVQTPSEAAAEDDGEDDGEEDEAAA